MTEQNSDPKKQLAQVLSVPVIEYDSDADEDGMILDDLLDALYNAVDEDDVEEAARRVHLLKTYSPELKDPMFTVKSKLMFRLLISHRRDVAADAAEMREVSTRKGEHVAFTLVARAADTFTRHQIEDSLLIAFLNIMMELRPGCTLDDMKSERHDMHILEWAVLLGCSVFLEWSVDRFGVDALKRVALRLLEQKWEMQRAHMPRLHPLLAHHVARDPDVLQSAYMSCVFRSLAAGRKSMTEQMKQMIPDTRRRETLHVLRDVVGEVFFEKSCMSSDFLHDLIRRGRSECVVWMLRYVPEQVFKCTFSTKDTVLHTAVSSDHSTASTTLYTLLTHLIRDCDPTVARNMLEACDSEGSTSLHLAARYDALWAVELLLDAYKYFDINIAALPHSHGDTPLHEVMQVADGGAMPLRPDPTMHAAGPAIAKLLYAASREQLRMKNEDGHTPFVAYLKRHDVPSMIRPDMVLFMMRAEAEYKVYARVQNKTKTKTAEEEKQEQRDAAQWRHLCRKLCQDPALDSCVRRMLQASLASSRPARSSTHTKQRTVPMGGPQMMAMGMEPTARAGPDRTRASTSRRRRSRRLMLQKC
jgi:hypothetical protein